VDNGSSDGSPDAVQAELPGVRVIRNPGNLGYSRAVNRGMEAASGRCFLLLNTDTEARPGSIETLVRFMDENPSVGLAGPQLVNYDGSPQNSFDNFPTLLTETVNKSLLRMFFPGMFPSKLQDRYKPFEVESVVGACLMARREAVERVGRLDERYFFFLEETDWCLQMRRAGWNVMVVPSAQVVHIGGASKRPVEALAKIEYTRSLYSYFAKNSRPATYFFFRTLRFGRVCVEFLGGFAACLLTGFAVVSARRRLSVRWTVLLWHVLLCPESIGLRRMRRGCE
jgi:GT2 family glycosyltransferase